jgi:phosphatidylinositol alpha-1,6-mannosyltransferase
MSRHLLLTYDFPPIGGGIARMMSELAKRYPPGSLLVSTGSYPGGASADATLPNPVDRVSTASSRLRTIQGLVVWSHRARALDRSFGPGFIWCGNLKPAAFPALWVNRRAGTPYGIFLHGTELLLLQHRVRSSPRKRIAARLALKHAAVLVAVSEWTRRFCLELLDEMGFPPGEHDVRTMHLGTDPVHFTAGVDAGPVRARYGLGEGRWLLTVARLAAHKGIDVGLKALAALRPTHPDLGYVVVGRGIKQADLEALARELGVADRVRFLTDVPDADLPGLYNAAEMYLGLSRAEELMIEGFGIAQIEASACGIPVIGGRSGGIPDAVRHGETGLLVDSTDVGAVVAAIGALLDDRELAGRLGRGGRAAVESHYNWDRVTGDVRRIGEELGSRSPLARLHPWRLTSS